MPIDDIVSEGMLGLRKAISKYEFRKGAKLSTYAVWWIRQKISRALVYQRGPVRLSGYIGGPAERALINSLNEPAYPGDSESPEQIDLLEDERNGSDISRADSRINSSSIKSLLQELSLREQIILKRRFGLDGRPGGTLEEVAKPFGLTRERIRQIQAKALKKLRKKLVKEKVILDS